MAGGEILGEKLGEMRGITNITSLLLVNGQQEKRSPEYIDIHPSVNPSLHIEHQAWAEPQ